MAHEVNAIIKNTLSLLNNLGNLTKATTSLKRHRPKQHTERVFLFLVKHFPVDNFDGNCFSVSDMGRNKYSESTLCLIKTLFL